MNWSDASLGARAARVHAVELPALGVCALVRGAGLGGGADGGGVRSDHGELGALHVVDGYVTPSALGEPE